MIIGISGKIAHGKDVIASYLVREHDFQIIRMSDALKEEVLARLRRTLVALWTLNYPEDGEPTEADIRWLVYERKPAGVRELLQEFGTEVRRRDDPDYWTKQWTTAAQQATRDGVSVVCPDVRFPNESAAVRALAGAVVRVHRPGFATGDHPSETALDWIKAWDGYFYNDRDIAALEDRVAEWLGARTAITATVDTTATI